MVDISQILFCLGLAFIFMPILTQPVDRLSLLAVFALQLFSLGFTVAYSFFAFRVYAPIDETSALILKWASGLLMLGVVWASAARAIQRLERTASTRLKL